MINMNAAWPRMEERDISDIFLLSTTFLLSTLYVFLSILITQKCQLIVTSGEEREECIT